MQLEPNKNKLETLLHDNLEHRRDELKMVLSHRIPFSTSISALCCMMQLLENVSVEDSEQKLLLIQSEYEHVIQLHEQTKELFDGYSDQSCMYVTPLCYQILLLSTTDLNQQIEKLNKRQRDLKKDLEKWRVSF